MRILLASSEVHPYSKSGGLADMVGALAKSFGRLGHQVGVVTPLYQGIRERHPGIHPFDYFLEVPLGPRHVQAGVWTTEPHPNVTIYFIDQSSYFDRAGLYNERGYDYWDNGERFMFFSKCVVHLARYLAWQPEVLHVHDWQTGFAPIHLLHQKLTQGWNSAPLTCLTIHNLAYQGHFPRSAYSLANLPLDYFHPNGLEFYGGLNYLKAGLAFADILTTVSPRYAREITTPEFGWNLDSILRQRQKALTGILNGVDYEEWNTENNPYLSQPYSVKDLAGKAVNKRALQQELGLPARPDVPLFGNISRLVSQKGVDIQIGALEEMLAADIQFVLLGNGVGYYEDAYRDLARRFPDKAAVRIGFDQGLSHRIEAGTDFFLMPSFFEPCGLNQLYSLRYGTIPIVRVTGGLDDTVIDAGENQAKANGIKFIAPTVRALVRSMRKAVTLYEAPAALQHFQRNGMLADFSWDRTTAQYLELFKPGVRG